MSLREFTFIKGVEVCGAYISCKMSLREVVRRSRRTLFQGKEQATARSHFLKGMLTNFEMADSIGCI